jgi:hypothetical protein
MTTFTFCKLRVCLRVTDILLRPIQSSWRKVCLITRVIYLSIRRSDFFDWLVPLEVWVISLSWLWFGVKFFEWMWILEESELGRKWNWKDILQLLVRPQQFLFLFSGQILLEINVGGRNKNKNKSWPRDPFFFRVCCHHNKLQEGKIKIK